MCFTCLEVRGSNLVKNMKTACVYILEQGHEGALVVKVFLLEEPPLLSMSFFKEVDDFLALDPPVGNQSFTLRKSVISSLPSLLNEIGDVL